MCSDSDTNSVRRLDSCVRERDRHLHELFSMPLYITDKKFIRKYDSERELSLRQHRTRTTKYNRLVRKFCHRSTRLRVGSLGTHVYQIQ